METSSVFTWHAKKPQHTGVHGADMLVVGETIQTINWDLAQGESTRRRDAEGGS